MEKIELSGYSEHLAPSKISFYSVLESRLLHLPSKLADDIRRTKTGLRGEIEAVDIFKKNGRSHWNYISNLWIDDNGRYEIDLLVITKAAIYVFEIKNYEGIFTYNNGDCTLGNLELDENCISQASRSHKKFNKFCKNANIICPVYGGLIFIGEYCQVRIETPVNNLHISTRNQLLHLIRNMITEEEKNNYVPINVENLILSLSKHVIQDPFIPKPLQTNEIKNIKRGICCSNCQNFILKFHKYYIECDCGLFESSEEAIVRTICEYGVLNYDQHMVRSNLLDFMDNQFSYSFLSKQLNRHFNRMNVGKPIVYENKRDTLDNLRSQFHFELPKNFYLNHEKYMLLVNRIQNSYIV